MKKIESQKKAVTLSLSKGRAQRPDHHASTVLSMTPFLNIKKIAFIILLWFSAIAASHAQTIYIQKTSEKISVNSETEKKIFADIKQGKAYLVDVRTPDEYNLKHLKYALNINIRSADFDDQIKKLDKGKQVYLYCHSGNRSGRAADSLQTLGYHLSYNIGALDSLTKAGFPVQLNK